MFTPLFAGTPAQPTSGTRRVLTILAMDAAGLTLLLLIPLFIFLRPYHALHVRAAAFDASPSCHETLAAPATAVSAATPCTIEWANVLKRYFTSSHSSRSGTTYRYYLDVRGGYGDTHTVELTDQNVWWRIQSGAAIRLQRWGDWLTAVNLSSGESSPTTQNPDWQLHNDLRGLRVIVIILLVAIGGGISLFMVLRQLP